MKNPHRLVVGCGLWTLRRHLGRALPSRLHPHICETSTDRRPWSLGHCPAQVSAGRVHPDALPRRCSACVASETIEQRTTPTQPGDMWAYMVAVRTGGSHTHTCHVPACSIALSEYFTLLTEEACHVSCTPCLQRSGLISLAESVQGLSQHTRTTLSSCQADGLLAACRTRLHSASVGDQSGCWVHACSGLGVNDHQPVRVPP